MSTFPCKRVAPTMLGADNTFASAADQRKCHKRPWMCQSIFGRVVFFPKRFLVLVDIWTAFQL
eukprot:2965072-Amphidinium_carterae.1